MNKIKLMLCFLAIFPATMLMSCQGSQSYIGTFSAKLAFYENFTDLIPINADMIYDSSSVEEFDLAELAELLALDETEYLSDTVPHGHLAVSFIEFMNDNLYNRTPFTYREKEAADWIVDELLAMGHDSENIFVQEFNKSELGIDYLFSRSNSSFFGNAVLRDYSQNIILTVPGESKKTIIVSAHYDTVSTYSGASDNASGTSLLLESAWRILEKDNYYTIVYIFFGAEELGLIGSHYYVDNLTDYERDNILFIVNADVLFEGPHLVYGAGFEDNGKAQENSISRQVDEIAQNIYDNYDISIAPVTISIFLPSDQLPFLWDGHTVVQIWGAYLPEKNDYQARVIQTYGDLRLAGRVLHSEKDDFHYINENWPGKIDTAMWSFSVFLEEILFANYD